MVINGDTVNGLIHFLVDGLEFRDLNGHPFKVSMHLLRHVGATAARHEFGLPLDIMAETGPHPGSRRPRAGGHELLHTPATGEADHRTATRDRSYAREG